jgi:hypothetical protein
MQQIDFGLTSNTGAGCVSTLNASEHAKLHVPATSSKFASSNA